jgi:hypothetical protein
MYFSGKLKDWAKNLLDIHLAKRGVRETKPGLGQHSPNRARSEQNPT